MSHKDEKTKYDAALTDIPALEEDFALEEILAEFGNSRQQKILEDVEREVQTAEAEQPATPEEPAPRPKGAEKPKRAEKKKPELQKKQAEPAPAPEELPGSPRPISLEEVVGSTVSAVMEENAEPILQPRRGLFSRRKLEETEQLFEQTAPKREEEEIEPIGPEPDPYVAAEQYRTGYHAARHGLAPAVLTALLPSVPLIVEQYGVEIPLWTGDVRFQSILLLTCLALTMLLCRQVLFRAVSLLRRKRCGSELLACLAAAASMGDCVLCLLPVERSAASPYGAAACLVLLFAQWGICRENRGMYDTFRTAAMDDAPPYLVTDTKRGACKQKGALPGFYTAAMKEHMNIVWQTALMPVVGMATFVFAGLTSFGQGRGEDFLLNWSALLAAGATCALPLCWGLSFSNLARHLQKVGCAVAGWFGAEKISCRKCMILTDADLFPPGTMQLNGIKIYGEEREKVIAYAATMAHCAGSGLERLFDSLLRGEMGQYEQAQGFCFYKEGGYSATIHGESVLLGTASFMRKMEVRLPGDIKLKTGIYLAVDRRLTAIFAVKYNPAENVDFALRMMRRSHIVTILASRDPNITPTLLKRKFHKGVKVEYPDLVSRVALSEAEKDRDLPRALLLREGLLPYAEAVVGSSRLCRSVRQATVLSLAGSILGTLLTFYLAAQSAYDLLTPLLLEVFLLLWTLPVFLLADRVKRS